VPETEWTARAGRDSIPAAGECAMSKAVRDLRDKAARQLRSSRVKGRSTSDRADDRRRADAYKALAESEEWLGGEKPRPRKRPDATRR
jgi:hypothetical protein